MAEQDVSAGGRGLALRVPLVKWGGGRTRWKWPAGRTLLLGGILVISGTMAAATIVVGLSMSRELHDLVDRIDRDESARMFDQAMLRSGQDVRVYVLPALRPHARAAKPRPAAAAS